MAQYSDIWILNVHCKKIAAIVLKIMGFTLHSISFGICRQILGGLKDYGVCESFCFVLLRRLFGHGLSL